jgi:hypothetical protein
LATEVAVVIVLVLPPKEQLATRAALIGIRVLVSEQQQLWVTRVVLVVLLHVVVPLERLAA